MKPKLILSYSRPIPPPPQISWRKIVSLSLMLVGLICGVIGLLVLSRRGDVWALGLSFFGVGFVIWFQFVGG